MGETINIKDFQKEERKRARKEKVEQMANKAKIFIENNRETLVAVVPLCIAGVTTIVKVAGKHRNTQKQEELKNEYCYDNRLGHYWRLRRPLTNKEWLEIDSRKRNGEYLSDILASMRVLK